MWNEPIAVALKYDGATPSQITAKDSGQGDQDTIELVCQYDIPFIRTQHWQKYSHKLNWVNPYPKTYSLSSPKYSHLPT